MIAALNEFTEQRVLRIVDIQMLARDGNGSIAAVTIEHIWWSRLSEALAGACAELVSDLETPKHTLTGGPGPEQIQQVLELNEMRKVGILTEGEFTQAKRRLLEQRAAQP